MSCPYHVSCSEAEACRDATNAAARALIAADLNAYLGRNPNGTFISWIASLHPENVHLDSRMWIEGNDWLVVWRDAVVNGLAQEKKPPAKVAVDSDMLAWAAAQKAKALMAENETLMDEIGNSPGNNDNQSQDGLVKGDGSSLPSIDVKVYDIKTENDDKNNDPVGNNSDNTKNESNQEPRASWHSWFTSRVPGGGEAAASNSGRVKTKEEAAAELALRALQDPQEPNSPRRNYFNNDEAIDPRIEDALES